MFKRILVPLDGSEQAERICGWVIGFANSIDAEVELLTVIDPGRRTLPVEDQATEPARRYLHRRARTFEAYGVRTTSHVAVGNPAEEIVARAGTPGIDLIAMATRRGSALARGVLGSVTDRVLRSTPVALLTMHFHGVSCPLPRLGKPGTIVVPLDGSDLSATAIPVAVSLAKATEADVVFIRVLPPPYFGAAEPGGQFFPPYCDLDEERGEASYYLSGFVEQAQSEGVTAAACTAVGNAARCIVEFVEDQPDALVVMSTHGASGFRRWIVGSVTEKVIRSSGQPVLALTPKTEVNEPGHDRSEELSAVGTQ